jgi:polyphosphate glucokinase
MQALGIDIGGSGIKGALVHTETGELASERHRIPTPQPATPEAVGEAVAELVGRFDTQAPVGCGFPAAIRSGVVMTASNIHPSWIGTPVASRFTERIGRPCVVANDADVAGLAELEFGAGRGVEGVVLMITIGTGLGTALFTGGRLLPNTELGHITLEGMAAERYASDAARKRDDLSWKKWGRRFDAYLRRMEALFWPDLIVLGGGASKKLDRFRDQLTVHTEIVAAHSLNQAGIVGAALLAAQASQRDAP